MVYLNDKHKAYCETFKKAIEIIRSGRLTIRTKTDGYIPFIPNYQQNKLLDWMYLEILAGRGIFLIILKPRQIGFSTLIAALFYVLVSLLEGTTCLVTAHKQRSQKSLFRMYKDYRARDEFALSKVHDNQTELILANGSKIFVELPKDDDSGRADTIRFFHGSEAAKWESQGSPELVMQGVMGAMPSGDDAVYTITVLESTGKENTYFHDLFTTNYDAEQRGEVPDWKPWFVPWTDHPEYTMSLTKDAEREIRTTLDPEEMELRKAGVTLPQLAWRRFTIRKKFAGNDRDFRQEFPRTVDEAFKASNNSYFTSLALDYYANLVRAPEAVGDIMLDPEARRVPIITEDKERRGPLRIYQYPMPGHRYLMAFDAAHPETGESLDGEWKKSDTWIECINLDTGESAFVWQGNDDPYGIACRVRALQIEYGNQRCMIVGEDAVPGNAVLEILDKTFQAPSIYKRKKRGLSRDAEETERLGYDPKGAGRSYALAMLKACVESFGGDHCPLFRDRVGVEQMRTFVRVSENRYEGRGKAKDDGVIARGMICVVASELKVRWAVQPQSVIDRYKRKSAELADDRRTQERMERRAKKVRAAFRGYRTPKKRSRA